MKHMLLALVILSQVVLVSAADKAGSRSSDQMQGRWKPIAAVLGGVKLEKPDLDAITVTIKEDAYEVFVAVENRTDKGTFTIDETTTPKRITIKGVSGPNKGKTIYGIFEIKDANAMRVCYDMSGKDFPKEFRAPKGTQNYLAGYRQQKGN